MTRLEELKKAPGIYFYCSDLGYDGWYITKNSEPCDLRLVSLEAYEALKSELTPADEAKDEALREAKEIISELIDIYRDVRGKEIDSLSLQPARLWLKKFGNIEGMGNE